MKLNGIKYGEENMKNGLSLKYGHSGNVNTVQKILYHPPPPKEPKCVMISFRGGECLHYTKPTEMHGKGAESSILF